MKYLRLALLLLILVPVGILTAQGRQNDAPVYSYIHSIGYHSDHRVLRYKQNSDELTDSQLLEFRIKTMEDNARDLIISFNDFWFDGKVQDVSVSVSQYNLINAPRWDLGKDAGASAIVEVELMLNGSEGLSSLEVRCVVMSAIICIRGVKLENIVINDNMQNHYQIDESGWDGWGIE